MAVPSRSTKERLLSVLDDLEVLSRELIEILALSRSQKLPQPGEDTQILELLVQRDGEFQELMKVAQKQGKVHQEMQLLEKEVEKRDSDIQQLQKQLKEAEHTLATAVYQAKEKLKSIEKARKGSISSEEIIKYAHRISASNAVCAPLNWVPGDPRRPYPTDLEMRSGMLGHMSNLASNGVNGHLPGDALAAGRLPGMPPVCFGLFADCFEFELKQIFKTVSCFPRRFVIFVDDSLFSPSEITICIINFQPVTRTTEQNKHCFYKLSFQVSSGNKVH
uniref:Mediator of RNA polymerase II transcription subunit 4 n=1 Tax=Paramormyrops kingsleyae TaxID=1676925 RepID=A0A3B3Q6L6_9TELE